MYNKTSLQIILILILILISFLFYKKYFFTSTNLAEKEKKIEKEIPSEKIIEGDKYNILKNIKYTSKDSTGNIFEISSEEGKINLDEPKLILMKKVKAKIYLSNSSIIDIYSDTAIYNNINHNTNFRKNILLSHKTHRATCEKLDLLFDKNLVDLSEKLIYENDNTKLFADKMQIDLITKNSKILMLNKEKKVTIISK
tara:strand:+ start:627 stop:1220 length:594 start_codon:yes stop_codon:yes gene_type:complete